MNHYPDGEKSLIEHISTHWATIEDPTKFVLRYAPAIREYIQRLLKGHQDSEDVTQDFLVHVMNRGFSSKQVSRGRFRDFLRVAVRNTVIDHWRARRRTPIEQTLPEESLAADVNDEDWVQSWRVCLLDKAWRVLRQYQRSHPGNIYHTVLKLSTDFPNSDSTELAKRAAKASGRPLRADTYRQHLHRAREKFAEIIVAEVTETLLGKNSEEIENELNELGLDRFVRDYLK